MAPACGESRRGPAPSRAPTAGAAAAVPMALAEAAWTDDQSAFAKLVALHSGMPPEAHRALEFHDQRKLAELTRNSDQQSLLDLVQRERTHGRGV